MELEQEIKTLAGEWQACQDLLTAIGDEVRQHLILTMMQSGQCHGLRVMDIARRTNLSRPAVSHHLQILKRAGIVKMRREGTKNYYYFAEDGQAFDRLLHMLNHARSILSQLPDRSGEDTREDL